MVQHTRQHPAGAMIGRPREDNDFAEGVTAELAYGAAVKLARDAALLDPNPISILHNSPHPLS